MFNGGVSSARRGLSVGLCQVSPNTVSGSQAEALVLLIALAVFSKWQMRLETLRLIALSCSQPQHRAVILEGCQ